MRKGALQGKQPTNHTQTYLPEKTGGYDNVRAGGYHDHWLPKSDMVRDRENLYRENRADKEKPLPQRKGSGDAGGSLWAGFAREVAQGADAIAQFMQFLNGSTG